MIKERIFRRRGTRFLCMITILVCFVNFMKAQDVHWSRWWDMPLMLNYSKAGMFTGNQRLAMGYRGQWGSVMTKGYRTLGMMVDMPWGRSGQNGYGGMGLFIIKDEAGSMNFQKLWINGVVSYHIRIGHDNYLSGGLGGGMIEYALDVDKLLFNSQFDGRIFNSDLPSGEAINRENVWMGEVGGGFSFRWGRKLDVGVCTFHGLRTRYGFITEGGNRTPVRWMFHGMGRIKLKGENVGLVPGMMMQYQGGAVEWVMSTMVGYELKEEAKLASISHIKAFKLGVGFRSRESVIPMLELEMFSFRLGISYDIVFSDLKRSTNPPGSLELTLRYIYANKSNEQTTIQK